MEFAVINKDRLIAAYVDEKKSTYEIAQELGTYANKVGKALKFLQIPLRSYSEAQAVSLQEGRSTHPTKGKKMSDEMKANIASAVSKRWQNLPQEEKDEVSRLSKERWDAMPEEKKKEIRSLAADALREASKEGSRAEKSVKKRLEDAGYNVVYHSRTLVINEDFEVDLFIPEIRTAIEIDGPSHFLPLWGEERLSRQFASDSHKQGLLLNNGYNVIRIRSMDKNMSQTRYKFISDIVIAEVKRLVEEKSNKFGQLIEIEVQNGTATRL